jgi:triacylglycerol lipase
MRGARGIEFGVDLPAIPALGLGSAPAGTSTGHVSAPSPNSNREAWYIREWTRFLGGWKRDEKAGVSVSTNSQSSSKEPAPEETDEERDEAKRQRQREFTKGDQVVRASTDKLSLVFDWIVDQVPNPQMLTGAGTLPVPPNLFKGKDKEADVSSTSDSKDRDDGTRKLAAEMIAHTVAAGLSSSSPSKQSDHEDISPLRFSSDTKPENLVGEVKKMMERERQRWKKNELATKADLERFYVALTRKMWDEGL